MIHTQHRMTQRATWLVLAQHPRCAEGNGQMLLQTKTRAVALDSYSCRPTQHTAYWQHVQLVLVLVLLPNTKLLAARRMNLPLPLLKLHALTLLLNGAGALGAPRNAVAELKLMSRPTVAGMVLPPLAANTKLSLLALLPGVPGDDDASSSSSSGVLLPALMALALLPVPTMAAPAATSKALVLMRCMPMGVRASGRSSDACAATAATALLPAAAR